ncbi:head GIN domain-containing protein [Hymenobacter sp. APR13]|uniref:head GIN domain-containing protein n=1 Tax=Hymenobacter sp. APR13 TaxID=1356852 RepID=UPI0004E0AC52|nr:head GIN domain-containing protein [Hymenobacter sp. APR13]AII51720.1 hypothetical protein N008_06940 [Hymenobacter sp. APR13]
MKLLRYASLTLLLALLLPALLLAAPNREVRSVAAFTRLGVANSAKIVLRQGSPQRVEVEATTADLARIETVVEGGRLRISTKQQNGKLWSNDNLEGPVTVYVTMPDVAELSVSGSGQIKAEGAMKAARLSLAVSGSGKILLPQLTASELKSAVSGSGEIQVAGTCPQHEARISGSGSILATELRTEASTIGISGSGNSRLYASRTLEASISGSGNVYMRGGATVSSKIAGSGRVREE